MSQVLVQGNLYTPLGDASASTEIRLTSLSTQGEVIPSTEAIHFTDAAGYYNFSLLYGIYSLEVNATDEFKLVVTVIVDGGTPNLINIGDLSRYSPIVVPPNVIPGSADWALLYSTLRDSNDTVERNTLEQIRDGNTFVSDTKQLLTNSVIGAEIAEEVQSIATDDANLVVSNNTYADDSLNESVVSSKVLTTRGSSAGHTHELTEASSGEFEYTREYVYATNSADGILSRASHSNDAINIESTSNVGSNVFSSILDIASTGVSTSSSTDYAVSDTIIGTTQTNNAIDKKVTTTDEISLQFESSTSSITNEQDLLVNVNDTIEGTDTRNVTVYTKEASSVIYNDGFSSKHTTNVDEAVFVDGSGTEVLNIDTVNNEITINGTLKVTNASDFKGTAGTVSYFVYQYSSDNVNYHNTYVAATDIWRRQAEVSGDADNPVTGSYSDGFLLNAVDGAAGDTLYYKYQYSTNNISWHEALSVGDIWRREQLIVLGNPDGPWSTAARIAGYDGTDGLITELRYQYAINGVDPDNLWHSNFTTGDHWRRERLYTFATQEDFTNDTPITGMLDGWNNIAQIVPIKGIDYGRRQATIYIYQRSATLPAAPTAALVYDFDNLTLDPVANLGTWTTEVPSGAGNLYVGLVTATSLGQYSDALDPSDWNIELWATSGYNNATLYLYQRGTTEPASPPDALIYDFTTAALTNLTGSWETAIPAGTDPIYIAIAQASSINTTDTISQNEWQIGLQGGVGLNQANIVLYQRSASVPSAPVSDVTYNFTNGSATGLTSGWYATLGEVPTAVTPLWITVASAINFAETDTITPSEWDVAKYSENGLQSTTITLYNAVTVEPTAFPVSATYTYATGLLTMTSANGWVTSSPTNAQGKIWVTQVNVIAAAGTVNETILANQWASATLFVEDGYKAQPVNLYRTTDHTVTTVTSNAADITYNFDTDTPSTPTAPWQVTIPTSEGKIWIQRGLARTIITNTTDIVPASEFAAPEVLVTDGRATDTANLFCISVGIPAVSFTSATKAKSTGIITIIGSNTEGWQHGIPDNAGEGGIVYIITNSQITTDNTDNVVHLAADFSSPTVISSNGSNGVDGINGLIVRGFWKVNPKGTIPNTPTGTDLTSVGTGWSEVIPTSVLDTEVIWVSYTYAVDNTVTTGSGVWTTVGQFSGNNGIDGANGVNGSDGIDIVFTGSFSSYPANPNDGESFYHTTNKASYVYYSPSWFQMTVDGVAGLDGTDGLSISHQGDHTLPPTSPELNWTYRDNDNGIVYICIGIVPSVWEVLVEDGVTGTAGDSVNVSYHDNPVTSTPTSPTNDEGTDNGWHNDGTSAVNWMVQKIGDAAWGSPVQIAGGTGATGQTGSSGSNGSNGIDGKTIRAVYRNATTKPSKPSGVYIPPSNWSTSPSAPTGNELTWVSYTYASSSTTIYGDYSWTAVGQLSGSNGSDGTAGENGLNGQGSFKKYESSEGNIPSNSGKDSDVAAIAGRAAQSGDQINYYGTSFSRYFTRGSSSWTEVAFVVEGDSVVTGSLSAAALKSGTSITDVLYVGNNQVTITGSGANGARIFAGHSSESQAPFRVGDDGSLKATDVDITGKITATSGSFSGDISGATGNFSGNLSGADITGVDGNFSGDVTGSSFNGIRIKIGSFPSTSDSGQSINATSYEGRAYTSSGSYTTVGNQTSNFSRILGVSLSLIGPDTGTRDMNFPRMSGSNNFIFDRDNGFDGTQYFSYIAWGI